MRAALIAGLALAALSAGVANANPADTTPLLPGERYGVEVKPAPQELMIAAHAQGLSVNQSQVLRDFSWRWINQDRADITISAPEHGPDQGSVYRTATGARDFLIGEGVPPASIQIVGYDAGGDAHAPIRVSYVHYVAEGPQCGYAWSNLSDTRSNQAYPEFGCAITANIAAQVADASDFLHPRATEPPDALRRQWVLGLYRVGGTTGTGLDPQANAQLSTVGQ